MSYACIVYENIQPSVGATDVGLGGVARRLARDIELHKLRRKSLLHDLIRDDYSLIEIQIADINFCTCRRECTSRRFADTRRGTGHENILTREIKHSLPPH